MTLAGMEVPVAGSDSVKWVELSVPSSFAAKNDHTTTSTVRATCNPLSRDCHASCSVIGDPPSYLIWRIHKSIPLALELLELSSSKQFPTIGLRITFPDALSPFVFLCSNQVDTVARNHSHPYLLCAITMSGIAYLFRIRNVSAYSSFSVLPLDELIIVFDMHPFGPITSAVAVPSGSLIVGRSDGSVGCFQLGTHDPGAPAFLHELRDDTGIGRLWGLISRGRTVGAVQDLALSQIYGKQLIFVLHSDGVLHAWDLSSHCRVFSYTVNVPASAATACIRLWIGATNHDSNTIPFAIMYRHNQEIVSGRIYIYSLHCSLGERNVLLSEPSMLSSILVEGECFDVRLTSNKIWILKDNGLVAQSFFGANVNVERECFYALQEEFVADQLFQSPEHSSCELILLTHSIFSSIKDCIAPVVSSIFLRRLLHPGVYHNTALRSTLLDYNRHWTDSDFQSLSADGLKKEILSVIENEGVNESLISIYCSWKDFCTRYVHNWCRSNAPCGLLVEPSADNVGIIRKNSVSLFRCMEDIERLIDGSSEEPSDVISYGLEYFRDNLDSEILTDLVRCVTSVSQKLGRTASVIFYETLIGTPGILSEEIVPRILDVLETGYSRTLASLNKSELVAHVAWERKLVDHKNLRKFSIDMLLLLHILCRKAATWNRVLNVVESYIKFLVPRKIIHNIDAETLFDINMSTIVQATSQVAKVMFEHASDILFFLGYLVNNSSQIHMLPDDITRIHLELVPLIQEIIYKWLIIHFFSTTPSELAVVEDFSSQLSLLQIDSHTGKRLWKEKLGKCQCPLAFLFLFDIRSSYQEQRHLSFRCLPNSQNIMISIHNFTSWIIWGRTGESSSLLNRSTELALILLRHGQYAATENLLRMAEAHLHKEKTPESIQDSDSGWCVLNHLLGCCLLAQAQSLHGMLKERKVSEAVRCFFRASSLEGASQVLQNFPFELGLPHHGLTSSMSDAAWKLHYHQWAMQIFEQYKISEGACEFALAALEQVEDALSIKNEHYCRDSFIESTTTIKGRLWSNVFKFALDLNHFYDAYCAIISNPDEESKCICLRRFVFVLCERFAIKILSGGLLPFVGLVDKVEQELAWKAERSDILAKPSLYKLLYAFEMNLQNWRRAATYMYQYSARLRTEATLRDYQSSTLYLPEIINGLSAVINALHLVQPVYAWIDPLVERLSVPREQYPNKKAKRTSEEYSGNAFEPQNSHIDIQNIEDEFVLVSAEYLLSLVHVKWRFTGAEKPLSDLIDLLVETDSYDMLFTVLLRFFKGSDLKRELERVFTAMSLKCSPNRVDSRCCRDDGQKHGPHWISPDDEMFFHGSPDWNPTAQQVKGFANPWGKLELYLERYIPFHARLPLFVAETLLRMDPQIELPLWLVNLFKDGRRERTWGMIGRELNPALLFQLYVDYGRYREATNMLLEYLESYSSMKPVDIFSRKRPFAVWFPYTTIQQLWFQLEEHVDLGHKADQSGKLRKLLHGAMLRHFELLKLDSDDAISAVV